MISILVDESFAFDLISISEIKLIKSNKKNKILKNNIQRLKTEVIKQIGIKKFTKVYNSSYYKKLLDINTDIFNLVELDLKNHKKQLKITIKNIERYNLKKQIQNKFFQKGMTEVKI